MEFEWGKRHNDDNKSYGSFRIYTVGEIKGLEVRKLNLFQDDRGYLAEIHRFDWDEIHSLESIQQVYIVGNWLVGTVRAFHKHEFHTDYFTIVAGAGKFRFFDDRPDSLTFGVHQEIIVSLLDMKMIVIPTGVYHGWKNLHSDTILVSCTDKLYMGKDRKGKLDEHRIPWDTFGEDIWKTEFK